MISTPIPNDYWDYYKYLEKDKFELVKLGILNDISRLVQEMRKQLKLDISDRIDCSIIEDYSGLVAATLHTHFSELKERCLINNLFLSEQDFGTIETFNFTIVHPLSTYIILCLDIKANSGVTIIDLPEYKGRDCSKLKLTGPTAYIKIQIKKIIY